MPGLSNGIHLSTLAAVSEETVFYQEGDVIVTQSRFIVRGETFAMRNITSVRSMRFEHAHKGSSKVIAVGLLVALSGFLFGRGAGWLGAGIIVLGIVCATNEKPTYAVFLTTSAGEVSAYQSADPDTVARIVQALNDSIIARG
jgi:hypothetical protein